MNNVYLSHDHTKVYHLDRLKAAIGDGPYSLNVREGGKQGWITNEPDQVPVVAIILPDGPCTVTEPMGEPEPFDLVTPGAPLKEQLSEVVMSMEPEYRCPKCGAQADERFDCCEVKEAPVLPLKTRIEPTTFNVPARGEEGLTLDGPIRPLNLVTMYHDLLDYMQAKKYGTSEEDGNKEYALGLKYRAHFTDENLEIILKYAMKNLYEDQRTAGVNDLAIPKQVHVVSVVDRPIDETQPTFRVLKAGRPAGENTLSGYPLGSEEDNAYHRATGGQIPKTSEDVCTCTMGTVMQSGFLHEDTCPKAFTILSKYCEICDEVGNCTYCNLSGKAGPDYKGSLTTGNPPVYVIRTIAKPYRYWDEFGGSAGRGEWVKDINKAYTWPDPDTAEINGFARAALPGFSEWYEVPRGAQ